MTITHYDLFAGIGGFSIALEEVFSDAAVRHIFCEWESFPTSVLRQHWPDGEFWGDIHDLVNKLECGKIVTWEKSQTKTENKTVSTGGTTTTGIKKNALPITKSTRSSKEKNTEKLSLKPMEAIANAAENLNQSSSTSTTSIMTAKPNGNGMAYREPIEMQSKTTFPILTNFCAGIATCLRAFMASAHIGEHRV